MFRLHLPDVAALALAAALTAAAPAVAADGSARFDAAMLAYERNHWTEAYAVLAALGDEGHAEAARIALQMWRYGQPLYGMRFAASTAQVQRWVGIRRCADGAAECRVALQQR